MIGDALSLIDVRLDFIWGLSGYAETDTCE